MQRVAEFEKVSFDEFRSAIMLQFCDVKTDVRKKDREAAMDAWIRRMYDEIKLPTRATSGSAGYDFHAPFGITLDHKTSCTIPTGVRVKIDEGWWMACLPRSGHGFKYEVHLANTCGVIDSDYYYADNEGHIFAKLVNFGTQKRKFEIEAGDSFMQAIFIPYGITHSDNASALRHGGIGSTGT